MPSPSVGMFAFYLAIGFGMGAAWWLVGQPILGEERDVGGGVFFGAFTTVGNLSIWWFRWRRKHA